MTTLDQTSLWIGFAAMLCGVLAFGALRLRKATPRSRGFYDKSILIVLVASCAYLAMAFHLGSVTTPGETQHVVVPRYIDWVITTPLLLLDIILFAKPVLSEGWHWDAMTIVGFDVVMIVTGVISALVTPPERWVWFWVSVAAYAVVASYVALLFRRAREMTEPRVGRKLRLLTAYLSAFWLVYPFIFALYFGNLISPGIEDLCYMILDVGAKVGFGCVLLLGPAVELVAHATSVRQDRAHVPTARGHAR